MGGTRNDRLLLIRVSGRLSPDPPEPLAGGPCSPEGALAPSFFEKGAALAGLNRFASRTPSVFLPFFLYSPLSFPLYFPGKTASKFLALSRV